jgi:hypothetical protein
MSLHLGRITLPEPTSWASTGDLQVTVTGSYRASSVTDGLVRRDQLLGMVDNLDEPVIPVVMDNEPRVTGYYRVIGASFDTDIFTRLSGNLYDYRVDLERVAGFTQPAFESVLIGALLTNGVGAVAGDMMGFHVIPANSLELSADGGWGSFYFRSSADGLLQYYQPTLLKTSAHFALAPANFYIGAATFEQGAVLQPVVGRLLTQPSPASWRLSNGLVRVTPNVGTPGVLDVSFYSGSVWSGTKSFILLGSVSAGALTGFTSVTVLRNSVEEVVIRLGAIVGVAGWGRLYIDLSLRRGDFLVRGYLTSDLTEKWQIRVFTAEAATAITYGAVTLGNIRATVNDPDGNRYVLITDQTAGPVSDLVNGRLTQNVSSMTFDFGIGSAIGGSFAVTPGRPQDLAQQYIAAQSESQRVVGR